LKLRVATKLMGLLAKVLAEFGFAARRRKTYFYLTLALMFSASTFFYLLAIVGAQPQQRIQYDGESIDLALEWRFNQPVADPDIVLVDIDERSLALLAEEYGRWPWPRLVIGEFLSASHDLGVKTVAVNILFSDPDLRDVESDQIFMELMAEVDNVIFPFTRLDPENDHLSQVRVKNIPGAKYTETLDGESTVAMTLPFFASAHDRMGANNLLIDDDGLIRRAQPWLLEEGFELPTLAFRTFSNQEQQISDQEVKPEFLINWRKPEGYERYSFADVYNGLNGVGGFDLGLLDGKVIVLGATAPGISILKSTPVELLMDDNLIIANTIDDLRNGTGLTPMPLWMVGIIASALFWGLAICYIRGVDSDQVDLGFVIAEILGVGVTLLSVSYTNYAIDLAYPVVSGFAFFSICKIYELPITQSLRANGYFLSEVEWDQCARIFVLGYEEPDELFERHLSLFERAFGENKVFAIDNFFGGDNFTNDLVSDLSFLVLAQDNEDWKGLLEEGFLNSVRVISVDVVASARETRKRVSIAMLDLAKEHLNEMV